jgi:glutamate dehydrogenase (NAD(P)+)
MVVTKQALEHLRLPVRGATVAMQGFGNVGSVAAQQLARAGCHVVAIGDRTGAIHNERGIDVDAASAWVRLHGTLEGFTKGELISNDVLLTLPVDVLVPAALENVITTKNAAQIQAKVVCEGANGPTTAAADSILEERGVFVIPDIVANAGGVTVSYFEWVQNRNGYAWTERMVNDRLDEIMVRSFHEVLVMSRRHEVSLRTAAYMLAVRRVAAVHELRGVYA